MVVDTAFAVHSGFGEATGHARAESSLGHQLEGGGVSGPAMVFGATCGVFVLIAIAIAAVVI
ncbi:hypothetical protein [Bradyrhizobium sp. BR 1432]|uniref:hypothetical protein n=1 Tax=Bradyrhizobium sp. BR 1432 TaxID=3447966 RepID=UPI003EE437FC